VERDLEGVLRVKEGEAFLVTDAEATRLEGATTAVDETLRDPRNSGRRLRVTGTERPTGVFEVREFVVIRGGKTYRLVYFCATCNITSFQPGDCVCCYEPADPVEIPPNDPRVYHPR
jgi:hypothetical protein